jgi:hypothetical protein
LIFLTAESTRQSPDRVEVVAKPAREA